MKQCIKCQEIKDVSDFPNDYSHCKSCVKKAKRYEYHKQWIKNHPYKNREYGLKYRAKNIDKVHAIQKRYYNKNAQKIYLRTRINQKAKPEQYREYRKKASAKIRKTISGTLNNRIASAMNKSLKIGKQDCKWSSLTGYTVDELKLHLEKQFKDGMSWERFFSGEIHIDHIIPKSKFNFEKPEDDDFKRCWGLKNLQPLWATDNLKKKDKIGKPFQPKLIFKSL